MPERYTDSFGNVTAIEYDARDLFVQSSRDAHGNTTRVTRFDFRILAPREIRDTNDNLSEVTFDALGLPAAMAVKGKGDEGGQSRSALTTPLAILIRPRSPPFSRHPPTTRRRRGAGSAQRRRRHVLLLR